ncbi:hypothetical protein E2C01_046911 [Portunus trituberculatus]|uniref:Uncharacterized protein n=1 Tax=Portunus trituberculatus TaxID=210409 RepID=A0A5B7G660_PORTR|nr:hypothetical protein [Portunus trituberculatus]
MRGETSTRRPASQRNMQRRGRCIRHINRHNKENIPHPLLKYNHPRRKHKILKCGTGALSRWKKRRSGSPEDETKVLIATEVHFSLRSLLSCRVRAARIAVSASVKEYVLDSEDKKCSFVMWLAALYKLHKHGTRLAQTHKDSCIYLEIHMQVLYLFFFPWCSRSLRAQYSGLVKRTGASLPRFAYYDPQHEERRGPSDGLPWALFPLVSA